MSTEKQINSRIIHKHDVESNWNKATTFIPNKGEIIIYDKDDNTNYERFKIGDGVKTVSQLPFYMGDLKEHTKNNDIHITAAERATWNAKQNAISGSVDQIVGFNESGNAIAKDIDFDLSSIIEQNKGLKQKFWRGTQAEYDAIETKSDDTMYIVTDGTDTPIQLGDMFKSIYDTENKNTDIFKYVDEHSVNIPITNTPSQDDIIWIDPSEDGDNYYYTINETNVLLQNKAPAGYGLGSQSKLISASEDLDNIIYNGWYYFDAAPINAPLLDGVNAIGYSSMLVSNKVPSLYVTQEIFCYSSWEAFNCVLRRCRINGEWKPWEWVDPPMMLGVEYRTTERHQGKPVYVKRIILDALAIGTEAQSARTDIDGGLFTNVCQTLVRHEMFVYPSSGGAMFRLPFIDSDGKLKAIGSMNQSNVDTGDTWLYGSIYTFMDLSTYKAMVTCWYTKTTD